MTECGKEVGVHKYNQRRQIPPLGDKNKKGHTVLQNNTRGLLEHPHKKIWLGCQEKQFFCKKRDAEN